MRAHRHLGKGDGGDRSKVESVVPTIFDCDG